MNEPAHPRPRLSTPVSVVVGLVPVAAALALGHLPAALVDPFASAFPAVGNTTIDLTPHSVQDFATRTFGEDDSWSCSAGWRG